MADKLTPENKKLAKMVQKIGSIDKKAAAKTPAKAPKKPAAAAKPVKRSTTTRARDIERKRDWAVDTTETAADRKQTEKILNKLDTAENWASRSSKQMNKNKPTWKLPKETGMPTLVAPKKSGTPAGQSAKSHQNDLTKVAGATAARNTKSKSVDVKLSNAAKAMKSTKKSFGKSK